MKKRIHCVNIISCYVNTEAADGREVSGRQGIGCELSSSPHGPSIWARPAGEEAGDRNSRVEITARLTIALEAKPERLHMDDGRSR